LKPLIQVHRNPKENTRNHWYSTGYHNMSHDKRVAVIGAGISGVVAAAHMKNDGLDVTVFERSSAAGGIW
jgi:ribulose 1,5-bisphosphate synthetase/thiazole synthase